MIKTDVEAYEAFPHHRQFFNKLWLAEQLGYNCGPAGTLPKENPEVAVIRPIYNLSGMGVGTRMVRLSQSYQSHHDFMKGGISAYTIYQQPTDEPHPLLKTPPGSFWCEKFVGRQLSTTYHWHEGPGWTPIGCWEATLIQWIDGQQRIGSWKRADAPTEPLPKLFHQLADVGKINVETVGGNVIEVHLRESPDPQYDELIPVFQGEEATIVDLSKDGYTFVYDPDDADGHLRTPRVGFMVLNHPFP